jgi:hypothetical protein
LNFTERFYVQRGWAFLYLGAEDTAGRDSYTSNVGVSDFVLLVTYVHLRNTKLSVYTEIHMECVTGAVSGNIKSWVITFTSAARLLDLAGRQGRYLGLSGTRRQGAGGDSTVRSFMIFTQQILLV